MKTKIKSFITCVIVAGVFSLMTATGRSETPASTTSEPTVGAPPSAPKIVVLRKSLSAQDLAKYQAKALESETAANRDAAGASDRQVVWIVVGVLVVGGVIALASGGGSGGGY